MTGCMAKQTRDYSLPEDCNNRSDSWEKMGESHRKLSPTNANVPAVLKSSFGVQILSSREASSFVVRT